ncbi:AAA family ATPase [Paraflavitalea pollutisoli]|uniref:AAA family ATPase n=1 Tax=Paraflavitalea pollutisoli TaxID=3034143 RepID=UPI0023EBFC5B|nr:AAA family ATPase [Paraflavitalea sp. H1-2-19X]
MNDHIKSLQEALQVSPDNVPLRIHLAEVLMREKRYAESAEQYSEVLHRSYGNTKAQLGLAEAYFYQHKYSAAIIIYEELYPNLPTDAMVFFVKSLIRENSLQQAVEVYQKVIALNPGFADEEIDGKLRVGNADAQSSDQDELNDNDEAGNHGSDFFLEKPTIDFSHVGGMKRIKDEISMKIIQPLKNPELYKAFGKKVGGGILLYGPPGCGKTYIAKATAGEIHAKFISIGLHDILDMWIGNSEKNLHAIFELARKNAPCVLFFDEVDAMGASRADLRQSAMRHVINQFLAEMDGVQSNNEGVLILAATNAPWSVDAAFRRPGRFDRVIFVEPPDEQAREEIITAMLKDKPVQNIDVRKLAKETPDYSGADVKAMIDIAIEDKLRDSMASGSLQPLGTKDLLKAAKQHRPTTLEWFASARNYALYANESGLYDDILKFLKIKK